MMHLIRRDPYSLLSICLWLFLNGQSPAVGPSPQVDFGREVKPILARHCYACHGPDESEGGLSLHTREAAFAMLDSGAHALVAADPERSQLLFRVVTHDESLRMPLDEPPLSTAEIDILRRWIEQGAEWRDHWAFEPRRDVPVPTVPDGPWARHPIDCFIWQRLQEHELTPASPASPQALVRRLYFDLTGLPPTPEEITAFLTDRRPDAYERLVGRLLASPHYGEKWGRHWLDLVRFAETNSFERDAVKPHAWRYRDYVIRAFNEDKPFDQLVREHLAGDELDEVTADSIIATGYYRLGLWDDEPSDPEQLKFDVLDDIIKTTSQVFLGLTMDCARCHDHKIDPIPQSDYYRLLAFFHNITPMQTRGDHIERVVFRDEAERAEFEHARQRWQRQTARLLDEIGRWEDAFAGSVAPGSELVPAFDLEQVRYRYYEGAWNELPNFDVLQPIRMGRIPEQLFSLADRLRDHQFAMVEEAELRVPADGTYTFELDGDDGVRLWVNGRVIAERDGLHQVGVPASGTATLAAGRVPIRLAYFQNGETLELRLAWLGPGVDRRSLVVPQHERRGFRPWPTALEHGDKVFTPELVATQRQRVERLEQLLADEPQPPRALCVSEHGRVAPATYVLTRGSPHATAAEVQPGFPQILGGVTPPLPVPSDTDRTSGRRRVLAEWLTADDHPLTARVIANRVWQYHFGRGIVRSANNFGLGGDAPTHPELLDWLASRLIEGGWSLKSLHRLIVTSQTYRMSVEPSSEAITRDPQNDWFSYYPMRRLTAEEIRDAMLAVNGRLNAKMGGPGFYADIPAEVLAGQSRPGDGWGESPLDERSRRSVYIHVKRSLLPPLLVSFDLAETDHSCPIRFATTQPTQALSMLNSAYVQEQAAAFAARLQREAPDDVASQIRRGYWLALGREPTDTEVERARQFCQELRQSFQLPDDDVRQQFCLFLYNLNEFIYLE